MLRFLVIGASGLIGRYFLRALGPAASVGTYRSRPFPGGVRFDMATDRPEGLIEKLGDDFTHALILSAIAGIDACATDPEGSARVNVAGAIRVIDALAARGVVPIFASSDAVYDGSRGGWGERDDARPILTYGRQKLAVEQHIARQGVPAVVLRLAKVLDPELSAEGVLGSWVEALLGRRRIQCATDQRFSPVGIDDVVAAIRALAVARVHGVFNLGGAEAVSRFELLSLLVSALSRSGPLDPVIETCSIRDFPFAEARPLDTTLSVARLREAIGYAPERLASLCERAVRRATG